MTLDRKACQEMRSGPTNSLGRGLTNHLRSGPAISLMKNSRSVLPLFSGFQGLGGLEGIGREERTQELELEQKMGGSVC